MYMRGLFPRGHEDLGRLGGEPDLLLEHQLFGAVSSSALSCERIGSRVYVLVGCLPAWLESSHGDKATRRK